MAKLSINGIDTYIQRLGHEPHSNKPVVIFIHGLVLDNLSSFYFTLATPLAKHAEVLLYDIRGHGKSQKVLNGYDIDTLLDDLDDLIAQLYPNNSVYLLGNSYGGLMALHYAKRQPQKTAGVILVDSLVPVIGWRDEMLQTLTLDKEVSTLVEAELYKDWHGKDKSRKRDRLRQSAEFMINGTSLLSDLQTAPEYKARDFLDISPPVLAVFGEESALLPRGKAMSILIPDCTLATIADAGHLLLFEGAEALQQKIVNWLDEKNASSIDTKVSLQA